MIIFGREENKGHSDTGEEKVAEVPITCTIVFFHIYIFVIQNTPQCKVQYLYNI